MEDDRKGANMTTCPAPWAISIVRVGRPTQMPILGHFPEDPTEVGELNLGRCRPIPTPHHSWGQRSTASSPGRTRLPRGSV